MCNLKSYPIPYFYEYNKIIRYSTRITSNINIICDIWPSNFLSKTIYNASLLIHILTSFKRSVSVYILYVYSYW